MNDYPQRIWKVSTGPAGIMVREYGARETSKMFKVSSDGYPPEQNIMKTELGKLKHEYDEVYVWVTEDDELQAAVDRVRRAAKEALTEKINKLQDRRRRLIDRPKVARFDLRDVENLEVRDNMF